MRKAHLDFFAFVFGEEAPPWDRCLGNTMVDENYMPKGFCLAWLRDNGTVTAHAYFGEWLKIYPKDILKGMKPVMDRIREAGVKEIWAVADENVEGSDTLTRWLRSEKTEQFVPGQGYYWRIDLDRSPI